MNLKSILTEIINEQLDLISGGKSDDMSIEVLAHKHKVPVKQIEGQLKKGIEVELEHTNDKKLAREIAKDHLFELPDYYDRLDKMEGIAKKELKKKNN